jgi:CRISPR/Cas system-associated protein Cas5 (RAMP superfamily)
MGCVHSCGDGIEESGEEIDSSNDGKRQEKKRDNATTKKEPNKDKSSEKDNKSWYLDPKEEESSLKANNSKDVKQAKDTNSKASPFTVSFLNQSNDNEACTMGTSLVRQQYTALTRKYQKGTESVVEGSSHTIQFLV